MESEMMRAVVLGLVQGITEFFPVSSTAHLILFPWFFGWKGEVNTLLFDVALHAGTLVALLICFYKDWLKMLSSDRKMLLFIAVATIPAGLAGVLFGDAVEQTLRNPLVIAFSTIAFGLFMLAAEKKSKSRKKRTSLADSLFIGGAQAVALIPGVSRSGITMTAGLFRDLTREAAVRFSFLLSTPIIGGATLLEGRKLLKDHGHYHLDIFAVGFLAAFVSGLFAIRFLLRFVRKNPLDVFVYYRIVLAVVILFMWART
ncbi:MAG: undecaprenyl-diphosphate phosphatase [Nitrospirae bacterium]|nr:undecaprenyl-diphosphate phosphatase [Nitrospirota bacterium]